jgi:hypothetical protein
MKNIVILDIFGFLKGRGIVANESNFSEDGLGCSESYLRKLRSSRSEPSMGAIAICASRLQKAGEELNRLPRYRQLGEQFIAMSEKCRALVNADAVEFELA